MYYKLWKKEQLKTLPQGKIPRKVLDHIEETISLLDYYYGTDRKTEEQLGGYVAVFLEPKEQERKELLQQQGLTEYLPEVQQTLCTVEQPRGSWNWKKELYLCSSDYHLILIYPQIEQSKESR